MIRRALGSFMGSLLAIVIVASIALLPIVVVLSIASALGAEWAIAVQVRVYVWLHAAQALATSLLPAWVWFILVTLSWLAFLDVHVRALVRDEFAKLTKGHHERTLP